MNRPPPRSHSGPAAGPSEGQRSRGANERPQQNASYRAGSRNSGNFRPDSGVSSFASNARQLAPFGGTFSEFDDVWGDDDDDDLVMASQQVEQQQEQKQDPGVKPSRRPTSSPCSRDAMRLEDIRLELAFKESNGENIRMEDFMQDGVLGRDISESQLDAQRAQERIAELERVNKDLKTQNYSCKGEVTNLRRLLDKQRQERNKELLNRQAREEDSRKQEAESRKKVQEELVKLNTELVFAKNQLRSANEKNEAFRKQLKRLETHSMASQSVLPPSQSPSQLNTSSSFLDVSMRPLPTTSLASLGFPSKNSFRGREVSAPPVPEISVSPKKMISTAVAEVQTEVQSTESPADVAFRKWKEEHGLQTEVMQACLEQVAVMATKEFELVLPKLCKVAQGGESELVKRRRISGYFSRLYFPDNKGLVEFKLDKKKAKTKGKSNKSHKNEAKISELPSQLQDWPKLSTFDGTIHQLLFIHQDPWGALCLVVKDMVERINFMRRRKRNSVFRANNCVHFFKLLSWSASLWSNFQSNFLYSGKLDSTKGSILNEIRQWTAAMLWIGNQYFNVLEFQVLARPFVLRTLTHMALNDVFHCTYANYLRVYYLIYHTLTIERLTKSDSLNLCLRLAQAVNRKKFCLEFICRGKNDETCLAYHFAVKGYELFKKNKQPEARFRLYENYVRLLVTIREWCCVHLNGEGEDCSDQVQAEDEDDSLSNPIFVMTKATAKESGNPAITAGIRRMDLTGINSFYTVEDISVADGDNGQRTERGQVSEPARKKQRLESEPVPSPVYTANTNKAVLNSTGERTVGDAETQLNEPEPDEVSEDEWDELRREAKKLTEKAKPKKSADSTIPCRKFLDCSLWEEQLGGTKVGHCQCRFYLLQTFMRMTEDVIHIWRHVKTNYEFRKIYDRMDQSEQLEEELDELIRSLDETKRAGGEAISTEQLNKDYEVSRENPFWKRIIMDSKIVKPRLSPNEIAGALQMAVDIIYEAYLTTQHNTRTAFGSEGTNSLHAVIAYLLQFCQALNFSEDLRIMLYRIAEDAVQGDSDSQRWSRQPAPNLIEPLPSGYENFDADFVLPPKPEFDLKNPRIRSALPASLVESIEEFENRKIEAQNGKLSQPGEAADLGNEEEEMEVDEPGPSRTRSRLKTSRAALNVSSDLFVASQVNPPAEELVDDDEDSCESESDSDSDDENNEENIDSGWETVDSDEDGIQAGDDGEIKAVKVEDYEKFCGPTLEEETEYLEGDEQPIDVTYDNLLAAFKKGPRVQCRNLVKFRSAKEACEELKKENGRQPSNPSAAGSNIEHPKEVEELVHSLMSRMSVKDYYKDRNPVWDEYKDRSLRVKI